MTSTRIVASLLAVRDWAAAILAGLPDSATASEWKRIESIPADVWRLFLTLERCAIPLLERLSLSGRHQLYDSARKAIRDAAAHDMQTALEARHTADEVDTIARDLNVPIVVLKGGVRAITDAPPLLPVVDLDILVRENDLRSISESLEAHGMGAPRAEAVPSVAHHLTFHGSRERLAIELHWSLSSSGAAVDQRIWSRLRPLGHDTALMMLANADQLAHLLDHALFQHADQSVTLRDALLIGAIASECTPGERLSAISGLSSDYKGLCHAMVAFGMDLYAANGNVAKDPMRETAAKWYAAVVIARRLPRPFRSDSVLKYVSMTALNRSNPIMIARDAIRFRGTSSRLLGGVRQRSPRIGAAITGTAHLLWYGALGTLIYPMIALTARRASRVTTS